MREPAMNTMRRSDKGAIAPPPDLDGALGIVATAVAAWPHVTTTVHWDLYDSSRVDGADFYVGELELGHLHLDGSLHLATSPDIGCALVAEGLARKFPYAQGWVYENVDRIGAAGAIALFRRNYNRLSPSDETAST